MPIITLETIKEYLPKYKPMGLPEESDADKAKRVQRRIMKLRKNAGLFADDDEVVSRVRFSSRVSTIQNATYIHGL